MSIIDLLKDNPFIVVESKATDENPFADNKFRLATPEEFGDKIKDRLPDLVDTIEELNIIKENSKND